MIEIKNLTKTFYTASGEIEALKNINITVNDGDIFGIIGMSGAGKSTLVRCINLLERPTEGEIVVDGVNLCELNDKELREKRRDITMIFQSFNLLMQRNCLKNVCFPLELSGVPKKEAEKKALSLLETVGLKERAYAYPAQLSGGQQQRVAIARALATNPKVLLCDEATSALDPKTTTDILELIREINKKTGITVIIITHQMSVVESVCNSVAILDKGTVAECGDVSEVFANPKSGAAKRLVCPESEITPINIAEGESIIRVVYNGANAASKPMITQLSRQLGIDVNISYASTRAISDKAYGTMLLAVKKENVETVIEYLTAENGITAMEVSENV